MVRQVWELARLAWLNVRRRPGRALLTVMGVAVGMTAVVGMLGLSHAVGQGIAAQLSRLGHDLVVVLPGGASDLSTASTMELDLVSLQDVDGVAQFGALWRRSLPISVDGQRGFLMILGLSPATFAQADRFFEGFALAEGRLPQGSSETALSSGAAQDLGLALGETVTIRDRDFTVSGVLEPSESDQLDGALLVPLATLWTLTDASPTMSLAWARAESGTDVQAVAERVQGALQGQGSSVQVQTAARVSRVVTTVLRALTTTLTAIAGLALLVGGLGLANTMSTAVVERTREIGVFMSVGARRRQIALLYVLEAGMLGLFGGLIGVVIGLGLALSLTGVIGQVGGGLTMGSPVDLALIAGALAGSVVLGALAGGWPARRAAALPPVEALRHE